MWNRAATVGAQCTSNLKGRGLSMRELYCHVLGAPYVEVSEEGVKELSKLRLIVILRFRDPKLET